MVLSIDLSTRIINKHKLKSFNNPCRHSIILEGPSHILIASYGKNWPSLEEYCVIIMWDN